MLGEGFSQRQRAKANDDISGEYPIAVNISRCAVVALPIQIYDRLINLDCIFVISVVVFDITLQFSI